jgi:excisionase family DNA binding protein
MAEAWVSVDEVAKHLGVTKDSIYRWIEHKGLPAHKI